MPRKLTQEEFEEKVLDAIGTEYTVLSEYKNNHTKIKMQHEVCGNKYEVRPLNITSHHSRCPICGAKKHGTRLKSTSQIKKELNDCTNGEYTMLSPYTGMHEDMVLLHDKCGYHWKTRLDAVINQGQRCPNCSHHRKLTTEEFKKQVLEIIGTEYTVLSEYKNRHTKIKVRHEVCGNEYEVCPNNITQNHTRCPKCFGNPKHTQEEAQRIVAKKLGPEFKLVSHYNNVEEKITVEHVSMKHTFATTLDNIIAGKISCPICNESHMESLTRQYLTTHNITFESQKRFPDCRYKRELPFDFYIPEDNTLIELDGGQHFKKVPHFDQHEDLTTRTRRDTIKDQYCTAKGINLLRIGYSELDNLTNDLDKYLGKVKGITRVGKEYQQ